MAPDPASQPDTGAGQQAGPGQRVMSWAEEDWTVGLSGRVLHKVKDLQVQQDRLSRENKQRQLQLDNSQDALNKQKIKVHRESFPFSLFTRPVKCS